MHDFADTRSIAIAYIGGGSLNWTTKLMGDIAHDGTLAVDMRLYDIDFAAAERNARLGRRIAEAGKGAPARARDLFGEMVAATAEFVVDAARRVG